MGRLSRELPVKKHYDIIVTGGGVAGCAAALTAAECGLSVLLIEKKCILGGLATGGLVNFMEPLCDGLGHQIIRGYAEKWTRKAVDLGYNSIGKEWIDGEPGEPIKRRYTTLFSANIFALILAEELDQSKADILYDCSVVDAVMDGNTCKGIVTYCKAGFEYYECDRVIDTTGDCDLLRQIGIPTVKGKNFFTYYGTFVTIDKCKEAAEKDDIRYLFSSIGGGNASLYGQNQPDDVPLWSGLSSEDVTEYLSMNQKIMMEKLRSTKNSSRDITMLPDMPQFRTTCHIKGDYSFTENDAYRHFDDTVCVINDFDRREYVYEVPLRCLINHKYPNIITAGRSADGTGYGWDLLRVIPAAIITGQAAACACALSIKENTSIPDVNIESLQRLIESFNIMVHHEKCV